MKRISKTLQTRKINTRVVSNLASSEPGSDLSSPLVAGAPHQANRLWADGKASSRRLRDDQMSYNQPKDNAVRIWK